MDYARFDTTPALSQFRDEVRTFLDQILTPELMAEARARGDEHHPDFFRALGARGWLIPDAAPEIGGAGLSYEEIEILDTEMALRSAPVINVATTRTIFPSVRDFAQPEIRDRVIREVTRGETALTLGYTEPSGGSDIAHVKTRAVRQPDGDWILNGSKVFTTGAHHARYIFLLVNTNPQAKRRAGLTMFLLPVALAGVQISAIHTLGERTNVVYFGDVRVPDVFRLGEVDGGWAVLQGPLDAEHGVGGERTGHRAHLDIAAIYARRLALAFEASVDWARQTAVRRDDPLIAYRLGEALLRVESGMAADLLEGRVHAATQCIEGTSELLELVAPDGLVHDENTMASHVLHAHLGAQVSSIYGGTVEVFRNLVARQLGLPAPRYD